MGEFLGPDCLIIEYGSGAGIKTRLLLRNMQNPAGYIPVDISEKHLESSAKSLAEEFPGLEILPVLGDFTTHLELPLPRHPVRRRAVFFPGSTIGNFDSSHASGFLKKMAQICGPGGRSAPGNRSG